MLDDVGSDRSKAMLIVAGQNQARQVYVLIRIFDVCYVFCFCMYLESGEYKITRMCSDQIVGFFATGCTDSTPIERRRFGK